MGRMKELFMAEREADAIIEESINEMERLGVSRAANIKDQAVQIHKAYMKLHKDGQPVR